MSKRYNLYHNKEKGIIKISDVTRSGVRLLTEYGDDVEYFNGNYFVSSNRKKLKDRAIEIKNEWIMGAKQELETYENINI